MKIIIDTGPIVAFLNKNDSYHHFVEEEMGKLNPPFYSCEAVITESFFLLQRIPNGTNVLIELLESGKIKILFNYQEHKSDVHKLLKKYSDISMSFADVCLVRMAETSTNTFIFTLDKDFNIYRSSEGKKLSLISPY